MGPARHISGPGDVLIVWRIRRIEHDRTEPEVGCLPTQVDRRRVVEMQADRNGCALGQGTAGAPEGTKRAVVPHGVLADLEYQGARRSAAAAISASACSSVITLAASRP